VVDNIRIAILTDAKIMGEDASLDVARELTQLVNDMSEKSLVLNLHKVQFMASAMIGKLVLIRNRCKARNINFSLCSLSGNVAEAIGLVRLEKIVDLFDDEACAIKACSSDE
jgi:anti-anti-sigma factor